MKVVFVSNYYNHHQQALCQALYTLTEGNFWFVATSVMRKERKTLGYGMDTEPEYVMHSYLSPKEEKACRERILVADVVIAGSAPEAMIAPAIRRGALVFRYSERPLKQGKDWKKYLPHMVIWNHRNPKNKPVYLLSASAYAPADYKEFGLFSGKAYRWGYFPQAKVQSWDSLIARKKYTKILWAGRLLHWKHPDDALKVAKKLREDGLSFSMEIVGIGPMERQLREMMSAWELEDCVCMAGALSPEQVRERMEGAGIFLFTSDKQEGWGAVANEAMNSGCAVVASHAAGSVPYLINNGQNGLVYPSGDVQELYERVKLLIESPQEQIALGRKAYKTIVDTWNASEAAKRLLELSEKILAGEKAPVLYGEGPCSPAPLFYDKWMLCCEKNLD